MRAVLHRVSSRQGGYTLIELLLYVAMVGVVLSAIIVFFGVAADARVKNQTITMINDQGTAVMDYLTQTVRNGTSISAPAAGASGASLTLVVPTGSLSPTIFDLSAGSALEVKEGAAAYVPLTSNDIVVSGLTFKNLTPSGNAGLVQISFTLSRTNPANKNEYDYQKTFTDSAEIGW